ncbi:TetR/AcrR family transcriptional regulator [Microlunatus soli]|uniref:Regulatory protein, tetR family n=1 Tax=Microlunatus soli TaxID=630515 RepID=A0A1H1PAL8_9ACTN|nr:TetR/AcrR family transcriptional regulator [Microlunatus soli]SDS08120.1 regulatory protein, tetR family [Microlunatus soli]
MTNGSASIWRRPARGGRGPTPSFDRDRLAAAGVALADERGLAAVTMRAVAEALGSKPASLYRYIRTRDELIELMVDRVNGEILRPADGDGWRTELLALARSGRDCYRRHPWLLDATASAHPMGPRTLDYLEDALSVLRDVPLPPGRKLEAIAVLNALTAALVRNELNSHQRSLPIGESELAPGPDSHPMLTAALAAGTEAEQDDEAEVFDRIVAGVISGLLG